MHPRHLTAPVAALTLALCLGACTGDPEPNVEDPPPSSSTPTVDPVTSAPPTSEPPETAVDFLRRWQAVGDDMQNTGESADYRKLMSRGCDSCESFIQAVEAVYGDGGRVEFEGSRVSDIAKIGSVGPDATFEMTVSSGKTRIFDADGRLTTEVPPELVLLRLTISRVLKSWIVTSFSKVPT